MKHHYLRVLKPIIHATAIAGAFVGSYALRHYTDIVIWFKMSLPPIEVDELIFFTIISIALYLLIGRQNKLFQIYGIIIGYFQRYVKTIVTRMIAITCIAFFGVGFIFDSGISRFVIISVCILSFVFITICDRLIEMILNHYGSSRTVGLVTNNLKNPTETFNLLQQTLPAKITLIPYTQLDEEFGKYDTIVFAGTLSNTKELQTLADKITIGGKEFFHIHDDNFLQDLSFIPQKLGPFIGLEYKASTINERGLVTKRIIDIIGAITGLIVLSPLMTYIAYRIKKEDGGPIFFKQQRVGRNGRTFTFYKFRSMKFEFCTGPGYGGTKADTYYEQLINSDLNTRPGSMPKIHNDPRVTQTGKRIRAKSLDELPQLLCVLVGDMSLIGPRPHLPREVEQYAPRQRRLFTVKPGITGYAQIFGRDTLDFKEEARLDLYYIQNWSLFLDIYVIFATVGVISKGR